MTKKLRENIRKQVTLFISENDYSEIENCRKKFNPKQYRLIKSHIKLCREDEIEEFEKIAENLKKINFKSFVLNFGKPIQFSAGNGVLLPVIGNQKMFLELRKVILKDIVNKPRNQEPYITIMHPRNSICTDEIFKEIQNYNFPSKLKFDNISIIEQVNGTKWTVLEEYILKN